MVAARRYEAMASHTSFIRAHITSIASEARHRKGRDQSAGEFLLPGFCMPKGIQPLYDGVMEALLKGTEEDREEAAHCVGDLLTLSSSSALRMYFGKIAGAIIRVLGDKFNRQVKIACLATLTKLIDRGGIMLKAFVTQLSQTIVNKALRDEDASLRRHAGGALGHLMGLAQPAHAEKCAKDLLSGATNDALGVDVQESMLDALAHVLIAAGPKVSAPIRDMVLDRIGTDAYVRSTSLPFRRLCATCPCGAGHPHRCSRRLPAQDCGTDRRQPRPRQSALLR